MAVARNVPSLVMTNTHENSLSRFSAEIFVSLEKNMICYPESVSFSLRATPIKIVK